MKTIIHKNLKVDFESVIKEGYGQRLIKEFNKDNTYPYELWVDGDAYYYETQEDRNNDFDFLVENLDDVDIKKPYYVSVKVKVDASSIYDAAIKAEQEIKEYKLLYLVQELNSDDIFEVDTDCDENFAIKKIN